MSLESAIERLAAATENNAAVREIIRQRDAWQAESEKHKRNADTYERWYREAQSEGQRLGRVINSLRGVITRMKKARRVNAEG